MVSTLLDELPCLLTEADELMARLSCTMTLLKSHRKVSMSTLAVDESHGNGDLAGREYLQQLSIDRPSPSSQSNTSGNRELARTLDTFDLDPIIKFFGRHFLTMQSLSFEKMNASLPVGSSERSALLTFATAVYQLMKRLQHWQQTSWDSLTRFFIDNSRSGSCLLTFDTHPHLTRLVLSTVTKYVKVQLLWSSFSAIPGLLALYSFLQHAQTIEDPTPASIAALFSPLEHTDHRVREFALHFGSTPLLAIQQDFQRQVADGGESLAALALSCFERYKSCHDLAGLRNQGVFDLEPLVGGAYASHSSLPNLLYSADIADWVICAVLCVPHQLQATNSNTTPSARGSISSLQMSPSSLTRPATSLELWHFVETIASDRLVFTVHRDYVVNLHDLLYHQVMASLSVANSTTVSSPTAFSRPSFGSPRVSTTPMKKVLIGLSKQALRSCGVNHRQGREIAAWLLESCVKLMEHNPGLVAPSFPLLLAALSIARDEIEWVTTHGVCQSNGESYKPPLLPSHVKSKHLQRVLASFNGIESELADLLASSHKLRGLIQQDSHFLIGYYQAFLVSGDAEGIAYMIQELLSQHDCPEDMQSLLKGFLEPERYRVDLSSSPQATWAREWRQTNAHFNATGTQLPLLGALQERMECAARHSQYICASEKLLAQTANFSKCWWFRDVIFEHCFKQTLVSAPSTSIGLLGILSRLASGDYALDELVDQEEAALHNALMTCAVERMLKNTVSQLELGLEAAIKKDVALLRDTTSKSHGEKPDQVERKSSSRTSRLSSFSRVNLSPAQRLSNAEVRLASPTSSIFSRNSDTSASSPLQRKLEPSSNCKRCQELVRATIHYIAQHQDPSIVQDTIVRRIQGSFTRSLRDLVTLPSSNATATVTLKCSVRDAYDEVQSYLRATKRLFGGSTFAIDGKIEPSLLGEKLQQALAKTLENETSLSAPVLPQDKKLVDWSLDAPQVNEMQQWSLVDRLSWVYVSIVTRRCQLAPPLATASMPTLLISVRRNCFLLAPGFSGEMDPRDYTDRESLQCLVELIGPTSVESICATIANLIVAQTLKLRSSLEAEYTALAAIDAVLVSGSDLAQVVSQLRSLDDLAAQLIQIGAAIFLLQLLHGHCSSAAKDAWEVRVAPRIVRELQQDTDRRATWTRLLPAACAAAFHANVWKRTRYLSSVEATDTNAHMMGLAMAHLLPAPHSSSAVQRCAVAALARASKYKDGAAQTSSRSKRSFQLELTGSESSARPLLEALELLVTTAASSGGAIETINSAPPDLELALERILPRAVLALYSTA